MHRSITQTRARRPADASEKVEARREFEQLYNEQWLIERHGFQPLARVRRIGKGGHLTVYFGPRHIG
jgi:hypothetical protein